MRYHATRKYPITQMKKDNPSKRQDCIVDLSLGAAVGIVALVFLEGMFWGYMIKKWRE